MEETLHLRSLRYFVALAEDLHFGRAATRLEIAQPSLSQQVKRLEEALGAVLFARSKRKVELTDAGRALLPDARELLRLGERMRANVKRVAEGEAGALRIGFVASGGYDILPAIVRRFREARPDARIEVDECALQVPGTQLEAGTLDVAIVRGPLSHPTLHVETLLREPLWAVVPAGHPLARRGRIPLAALAGETFALFPRHRAPAFYDAITSSCRQAGFAPRIAHEAADWQVLVSLVAAGLAVTLAPASVRRMPRAGVRYRPIQPARAIAELVLLYSPARLSPLAAVFLRVARETARRATAGRVARRRG